MYGAHACFMHTSFETGYGKVGEIKTESRILISQIKTLTPPKYQHLSQPNIAIYANNFRASNGNVSCVEWDEKYDKGYRYYMKNIKLPNGSISDGNWHEVTLEYIPSLSSNKYIL